MKYLSILFLTFTILIISCKDNDIVIKPNEWIYVDLNGWVISKSELEF